MPPWRCCWKVFNLSPSRPLAAQRLLQRPIAKRLTLCSRDISSWLSPWAKLLDRLLAAKTSTQRDVPATGEPSDEIVKFFARPQCGLDRDVHPRTPFISDLPYGSTADKVRRLVTVPVLLLKAKG